MFQNTISRNIKSVRDPDQTGNEDYLAQSKPDTKVTTAAAMLVLWLCICLIEILDAVHTGPRDQMGGFGSAD